MFLTQLQQYHGGSRREEQPFAEQQPLNHFWPIFQATNDFCCGHQYALWRVVTAAGVLSQQMIVSTPAAENTQASNIPSESRSS